MSTIDQDCLILSRLMWTNRQMDIRLIVDFFLFETFQRRWESRTSRSFQFVATLRCNIKFRSTDGVSVSLGHPSTRFLTTQKVQYRFERLVPNSKWWWHESLWILDKQGMQSWLKDRNGTVDNVPQMVKVPTRPEQPPKLNCNRRGMTVLLLLSTDDVTVTSKYEEKNKSRPVCCIVWNTDGNNQVG